MFKCTQNALPFQWDIAVNILTLCSQEIAQLVVSTYTTVHTSVTRGICLLSPAARSTCSTDHLCLYVFIHVKQAKAVFPFFGDIIE